jgi:hypothetical protein
MLFRGIYRLAVLYLLCLYSNDDLEQPREQ